MVKVSRIFRSIGVVKTELFPHNRKRFLPTQWLLIQSQQQKRETIEICSKLKVKTPERRRLYLLKTDNIDEGVFIVNFDLLTLNKQISAGFSQSLLT